jgi:tetratricopeptide (TPR) repeat protein
MKPFILMLFFVAVYINVYGQKIDYYSDYETALTKSKRANKLMFVVIDFPHTARVGSAAQQFQPGLENSDVVAFYNKKFINVNINIADSAYSVFRKHFPLVIKSYPTYYFIDDENHLVYKGASVSTSNSKHYLDMGNEAIKASGKKTISYFEKLRKQGKLDGPNLKEYILLKQSLGLNNNACLIEYYVNTLTIQSFNNYNKVLFILTAGPIAYGRAYNLCYTNKKIADSIYKHEPNDVRVNINNHILENTRREAISTKNVTLATQVSNFSRSIRRADYQAATQWSAYEMLNYYHQVRDTSNYYRQAGYYYDTYYMRITPDSIKRMKERSMEASKVAHMQSIKQVSPNVKFSTGGKTDSTHIKSSMSTVAFSSAGGTITDVPNILNNVAYTFYRFGTRNPIHLTKALLWCKRAISLSPNSHGYYDTMAHILYRLDLYDEALLNQNKAIELARKETYVQPAHIESLQKELSKMQQRQL